MRLELAIEEGALVQVPVLEPRQNGNNWLATIALNPRAPGGLDRTFVDRAGGSHYYYFVEALTIGDAVEFGADLGARNPKKVVRRRWYGVVVEIREDALVLEEYLDEYSAVKAAEALISEAVKDLGPAAELARLRSEEALLEQRLEEVRGEHPGSIRNSVGERRHVEDRERR